MFQIIIDLSWFSQELKKQAPPYKEQNSDLLKDELLHVGQNYLWNDVFGMVSVQKSLVENLYVTPIWWNGHFGDKDNSKGMKGKGTQYQAYFIVYLAQNF